ncbi:MAG: site-specific DNA-methyltransferase, partial [Sulfitobacter sp.]|nr:site-specific DNA-methyltransferase [Sulfitobacter sp.]
GRLLDPFMGSGTVAVAAERHDRDWLGIELNPTFAAMAQARVGAIRLQKETANERRTA